MTVTPVELSPYRSGVCWHGVRATEKRGPSRFCGEFAELCEVEGGPEEHELERVLSEHMVTRTTKKKGSRSVMFLCRKHRESMRARGYTITLVTIVTEE